MLNEYQPRVLHIALPCALTAAFACPASSQSFGPQQVITTQANGAWSVFAADLDGDGDSDALSASAFDDEIAWYKNTDGLGSFGPQILITNAADFATSVHAADLDADGDLDVISTSLLDDTVAWYRNTDALGSFGAQQIITTAADGVWSACAADLDGDGDRDVLSASVSGDQIAWHKNTDGLGTFAAQEIITTAVDAAYSAVAADLDGDGDQDVLSASFGDDKIAWYTNTDGLGSFGPQKLITQAAEGAFSVFAADLDGDGHMDVLSASADDDRVAWYENQDGLGTFGPQQIVTGAADYPTSVFATDLDGDGDQDVLSASNYDDKIAWYENTDGLGSFGPQEVITTRTSAAFGVFAADIDGDGHMDVLSASQDDDTVAWYENLATGSPLSADPLALSLATGGTQSFSINAGPTAALNFYLLLGSLSGTAPGTPIDGLVLPLNLDAYFLYTIEGANSGVLQGTFGSLLSDGSTTATVALNLPSGLNPGLAGATLHHAYAVFDLSSGPVPFASFVSNAVPLTLVP